MKNINQTVKQVRELLDQNAPVILTGMALVGLGGSVYLTAKGAFKAKETFDQHMIENPSRIADNKPLTKQEKFLLTYKFYAPAAVAVVGTGTCMVLATKIGLNRTAALGAALVVVERNNEQYRDKVKELLGDNKHLKVSDAVAADQVATMGPFPLPREGEQTFVDLWTGRDLSTKMEKMEKAVNDFNKNLLYNGYSSLNEFYHGIDLDPIQQGDHIGWNIGDGGDRFVELAYTTTLKDERAVVAFKFDRNPMPGFRDSGNADI